MVSFQTSAGGFATAPTTPPPPPTAAPSLQPESTQPTREEGDSSNEWMGSNSDQYVMSQNSANSHGVAVPKVLQPGLGSAAATPLTPPQIQPQGAASDATAEASADQSPSQQDMAHIPSILLPGGKSPSSNPFRRNRQASAAGASSSQVPADLLSKMHLDAATANDSCWSSNQSEAVELDAMSYAHPPKPLSVPQTTGDEFILGSGAFSKGQDDSKAAAAALDKSSSATSDEFAAHIFDEHPTLNHVGTATPQTKRSETNKTAKTDGEDSDQDDWNVIGSETSSIAGGAILMASGQSQASEGTAGKSSAPPVSLLEPKNEAKHDNPLIELLDCEPSAQSSQSKHEPQSNGLLLETDDGKPALPPRQSQPVQRWSATRRQPVDGKAETYQIKKIRWHDANSKCNPTVSSILVQNENGPCPLVALVNALSLTAPADSTETTIAQVLGSREVVSLSLVLDAVFEELMSPRRTWSGDALPDMGELYEFLKSLHTGMNVNPRFIPPEQMVQAHDISSPTDLHLTQCNENMAGTFEESPEMKLYATFTIPLIHGWLPAKSDAVFGAFERQAATYEDAQNLLFRQDELEAKLSDPQGGLSRSEQQLYQDVMSIKMFMIDSATQLTTWGIDVISKAIRPGTFAILFRNDHFSTLYCHPATRQLLTLVTDAGYSSHEEVVWQSLADINGELSELYSGDFRPVGSLGVAGSSSGSRQSNHDGSGGQERAPSPNRRGKDRQQEPTDVGVSMSAGVGHEQEDGDLALALQLQEEEEEKQRAERQRQRRRQELRLSEQFIEQQGRQRPQPVARNSRGRSIGGGGSGLRPASSHSGQTWLGSGLGGTGQGSSGGRGRDSNDGPPPPSSQPPRRKTQQPVRSLVPPATTTTTTTTTATATGRQGVNRSAAVTSGEDAPPSYEAAQHDRRYMPTAEQPNPNMVANAHPAWTGANGGSMLMAGEGGPRRPGYNGPGAENGGYRPSNNIRLGGRIGQGTRDRDRDCVVM